MIKENEQGVSPLMTKKLNELEINGTQLNDEQLESIGGGIIKWPRCPQPILPNPERFIPLIR